MRSCGVRTDGRSSTMVLGQAFRLCHLFKGRPTSSGPSRMISGLQICRAGGCDNKPVIQLHAGRLTLAPHAGRKTDPIAAVLARNAPSAAHTVTAVLDRASLAPEVWAGITAYGDPNNALRPFRGE